MRHFRDELCQRGWQVRYNCLAPWVAPSMSMSMRYGRAFVRGNVIVETRTGRILYALVQRINLPKRIDVYATALETAERVFAAKVERAITKAMERVAAR